MSSLDSQLQTIRKQITLPQYEDFFHPMTNCLSYDEIDEYIELFCLENSQHQPSKPSNDPKTLQIKKYYQDNESKIDLSYSPLLGTEKLGGEKKVFAVLENGSDVKNETKIKKKIEFPQDDRTENRSPKTKIEIGKRKKERRGKKILEQIGDWGSLRKKIRV